MTANFYANVGRTKGTRDPLDVYETPGYVTRSLLTHCRFRGPVLEPAAGSGRISAELRVAGLEVEERDIRTTGDDFLEAQETWHGDVITNPPYAKGLAKAFVERALRVADGRVAMLLRSGFLWSDDRRELFRSCPPELALVMPDRILFIKRDGDPISGQAHSHMWLVWPERELREDPRSYARRAGVQFGETHIEWVKDLRDD